MNSKIFSQKLSLSRRIIIICSFLSIGACNKDQHNHPELTTGKDLFDYHCASCHKKDGSGIFFKGVPANIATDKSQLEISLHIKRGSQSKDSSMPVFKSMPDTEAQKIANYLLQLKIHFFNNPDNKNKMLLKRRN